MILFVLPEEAWGKYQFQLGERIKFYARKSITSQAGKKHRLLGEVIITHNQDTLYGERADIDIEKGSFSIEGNVRFVNELLTVYSSSIEYDQQTDILALDNARLLTEYFSLVSKKVERIAPKQFLAYEAEYTSCRDCPESWTIFGQEVSITLDEYVRVKHALIKIRGVPILYLPYIVFPIKDERETGLLFPKFSTGKVSSGIELIQPWFWAISKSVDATFAPSYWGERGWGLDLQARARFNNHSWLEHNTRMINDRVYTPASTGSRRLFRHFSDFETHQQYSRYLWAHSYMTYSRDLDFVSDQSFYTEGKLRSSELGAEFLAQGQNSWGIMEIYAERKDSLLFEDPLGQDKNFVQTFPKIRLHSKELSFAKNRLRFNQKIDWANFRQIDEDETQYIRNFQRLILQPELKWKIGTWKNILLESSYNLRYIKYRFSEQNDHFEKHSGLLKTRLKFSFAKTFGEAYITKRKISLTSEENESQVEILGKIPRFEDQNKETYEYETHHAYRHYSDFQMEHYFLTHEKGRGNRRFESQILNSRSGWIDFEDSFRSQEADLSGLDGRKQINPSNSIDLQWNNTITRKTPLRKNGEIDYSYYNIGYFNVAQEIFLGKDLEAHNRLGRFLFESSLGYQKWSLGLNEYYFHDNGDNILNFYGSYRFGWLTTTLGANFYDLDTERKTGYIDIKFVPMEQYVFKTRYERDFVQDRRIRSIYQLEYWPDNHCWGLILGYRDTVVDKRVSLNFSLNFSGKNFIGFGGE